jgi:hypothetical protein
MNDITPLLCEYCNKEYKNNNGLKNHQLRCKENPTRILSYFVNNQDKLTERRRELGFTNAATKAKANGTEYVVSEQTRKKLSIAVSNRTPEFLQEMGKLISIAVKQKVDAGEWHTSLAKNMHIDYNGVDLHGKWELRYAQYLDENNILWKRPTESFEYVFENVTRKYTPDFYLIETDEYVEIKGYKKPKDEAKWSHFPSDKILKVYMKQDLELLGISTK